MTALAPRKFTQRHAVFSVIKVKSYRLGQPARQDGDMLQNLVHLPSKPRGHLSKHNPEWHSFPKR